MTTSVESLEPRALLAASLIKDVDPTDAGLSTAEKIDLDGGGTVVTWTDRGLYRVEATSGIAMTLLGTVGANSDPALVRAGGLVYFRHTPTFGVAEALWRTDGTPQGTFKLLHPASGYVGRAFDCGGTLYFSVGTGKAYALWLSDGTVAGTRKVRDFTGYGPPIGMAGYNGKVYFSVNSDEGNGLWSTDGTAAGTALVRSFADSNSPTYGVGDITVGNGLMYFSGYDATTGTEPWRSDGTAAGTFMLRNISSAAGSSYPEQFTAVGSRVVFVTSTGALYRSDGTTANTQQLSLGSAGLVDMGNFGNKLARLGGHVYFTVTESSFGRELYRTDGTTTQRVTDIVPGPSGSAVNGLRAAQTQLYFWANDGSGDGPEMFASDGTAAGTRKISALPGNSAPAGPTTSGDFVFFTANDPMHGDEVHLSAGTLASTRLAANIVTTPNSANPGGTFPASNYWARRGEWSATVGNTTFFPANGELWKTDGTDTGTVRVQPAFPTSASIIPLNYLSAWNGAVYYWVDNGSGASSKGIWRSDGTVGGAVRLTNVDLGSNGFTTNPVGSIEPSRFVPFNGSLYFFGGQTNLFRTDGTPAGTVNLSNGAIPFGNAVALTATATRLFFVGASSVFNKKLLWTSDGTTAGTRSVQVSTDTPYNPTAPVAIGNYVYFFASDSTGSGLWRSDGTTAGTVRIVSGVAGTNLTRVGNKLYFVGSGDNELWVSDTTAAGTRLVKDIYPGAFYGTPQYLTAVGDKLYFTANNGTAGAELWVTDGTAGGTTMVRDVRPGAAGAFAPDEDDAWEWGEVPIMPAGDVVFFVADDGVHGRELWQTGGTFETTMRVTDLQPGSGSGNPHLMSAITPPGSSTSKLLFAATSPQYGRELFGADAVAALPVPPAWLVAAAGTTYYLSGETLAIQAGSVTIDGNTFATHPVLDLVASGTAAVTLKGNQRMRALTLADAATATVPPSQGTLMVDNLSIGNGARLDLGENDLIVDYAGASVPGSAVGGAYGGVTGLIQAGHRGGAWDGFGIVTSQGNAVVGLTTLAAGEASVVLGLSGSQTAVWSGYTVDATAVLVKYTYAGDANLDGIISGDDYAAIDFNIAVPDASGWYKGDFNYDGIISGDDYSIIDFNIVAQGAALSNSYVAATRTSAADDPSSAVGERGGAMAGDAGDSALFAQRVQLRNNDGFWRGFDADAMGYNSLLVDDGPLAPSKSGFYRARGADRFRASQEPRPRVSA